MDHKPTWITSYLKRIFASYLLTLLILTISPISVIQAQSTAALPQRPTGMVNDYGNLLDQNVERILEQKLRTYRDTTSNVISIAILNSLEGNSREEAATYLFNTWRMWEGDRYNGVLILIAVQERELQIEVGYGLEGAIPDVMANRIVQDILIPALQQGRIYEGLDRATSALMQLASGEFEAIPSSSQRQDGIPIDIILIVLFILFFIITKGGGRGRGGGRTLSAVDVLLWSSLFNQPRRGGFGGGFGSGGFGGGGGFGGFSGGGGFGSGGGGAGGSW